MISTRNIWVSKFVCYYFHKLHKLHWKIGWLSLLSSSFVYCTNFQNTKPPVFREGTLHVVPLLCTQKYLLSWAAAHSHCQSKQRLIIFLKGTVSRDFLLLVFFHESVSPKPLSIPLGPFRIFSKIREDCRRYQRHRRQILPPVSLVLLIVDTGGKLHRYQRRRRQICHRWQTMGLISGCRYLKVNLKAKIYIYVKFTIQRCPNKIIEIFLIETGGQPWAANFLREFSKKFEKVLMGYSEAGVKLFDEKNQKQKISWHSPFKTTVTVFRDFTQKYGVQKYRAPCSTEQLPSLGP